MRNGFLGATAALAMLALAACASPVIPTELGSIDQFAGYRYNVLNKAAPKAFPHAGVLLSFSGGGTRAAAFADGVLHALAETRMGNGPDAVPLASDVDVVSSVSGGSVTAAYFGVNGVDGLTDLENNFLYVDVQGELIGRAIRNPTVFFYPRINALEKYLEDKLFHEKTYKDIIDTNMRGRARRPYVILNAADMGAGSVFSFTQDQFDLICGDLSSFHLANAVAASAAFPVLLSSLTIKNRAPCMAHDRAPMNPAAGWTVRANVPQPVRLANDRDVTTVGGLNYPAAGNLARYRRGTTALTYLNRTHQKEYIQLLDGGIADNLGLTMPFTFFTSPTVEPSFLSKFNSDDADQQVDKLLLVVVNARGETRKDFDLQARPPGAGEQLLTSIGTPIDAVSFQFLGQLDQVIDERVKQSVVVADFDFIDNAGCRAHFHELATSWALARTEVDDLIALGRAMVLQSPDYKVFVESLGGTVPMPARSIDQICAPYRQ
jgi:NTE family protein